MSLPRFSPLASHLQRAQGLVTSPFNYILPPSTIAAYPLPDRASSKLLVVPRHSSPTHHRFSDLPTLIPSNSLLVLNSSKVIPTRIPAQKCTGGKAEVFLLEPLSDLPQHALESPAHGQMWRAIIGGKRIKKGDTLTSSANSDLNVRIVEKENNSATVCFNAPSDHSLSSLLNAIGEPPLPPYLKRPAESEDTVNYQTVYAREQGSVAAPTAGLHMTERLMNQLCERGVKTIQVVLHVGAGTFRQLESQVAGAHQMHGENILVQGRQIETLLSHIRAKRPVVAVGTTSVRTLESLYWFGLRLFCGHRVADEFRVGQWEPYEALDQFGSSDSLPSADDCLSALLHHCGGRDGHVYGKTNLLIVPGYPFRTIDALVTNFHQPRSTLLMLVSAFHTGNIEDLVDVYNIALKNDYRFLSYGDSSIYAGTDFFEK